MDRVEINRLESKYLMEELNVSSFRKRDDLYKYFSENDMIGSLTLQRKKENDYAFDKTECEICSSITTEIVVLGELKKLNLDKESFLAKDAIVCLNECSEVFLKKFSWIKFENCVFYGNLTIQPHLDNFQNKDFFVEIEHSLFFGDIRISPFNGRECKVRILNSALDRFFVDGDSSDEKEYDYIAVGNSNVGLVFLDNLYSKAFRIFESNMQACRVLDCIIDEKKIVGSDIDVKKTLAVTNEVFQWNSIPLNTLDSDRKRNSRNCEESYNARKIRDTIDFLNSAYLDLSLQDKLRLQVNLQKITDSMVEKVASYIALILNYPFRIFLLMVVTICLFAIFFYDALYYDELTRTNLPLEFSSAIIFSIITFTTIGFGNVVPNDGLYQFLAGVEGVIGVLLSGAFLASLTRKYWN